MHISEIDPGRELTFNLGERRQAYMLCVEGALEVRASGGAATRLQRHDAAEVRGAGALSIKAAEDQAAHVLLLEMAQGSGGRGDF